MDVSVHSHCHTNIKITIKDLFLKIWLLTTGRIQSERQQALEKMGISVQASGIKVEKNKYYLVNLNADPSLNELLVYYLKVRPVKRLIKALNMDR